MCPSSNVKALLKPGVATYLVVVSPDVSEASCAYETHGYVGFGRWWQTQVVHELTHAREQQTM